MAKKNYIERGALLEDARHDEAIRADSAGIVDIANLINDQPTADVVEVRHGRFVDAVGNQVNFFDYRGRACDKWGNALYRPIYCSECHICLAGMNDKLNPQQRNYCSNCGAYMGGKGEDK